MENLKNPRAQSTVEYLVISTVIIIGIIALSFDPNGPFQQNYLDILKERAVTMDASTLELTQSTDPEPTLATCKNGVLDPGEVCEGSNFGGETCVSQGYPLGGPLTCKNCRIVTKTCNYCGNGIKQLTEECDGTNMGGKSCFNLGFLHRGTLRCTSSCILDTSLCLP